MSDRPASEVEQAEEQRNRYPDVIRVAAGLAAHPGVALADPDEPAFIAGVALAIVLACEAVCGIGDGE